MEKLVPRHAGLAVLLLLGCAPDLRDDFPFDGELPDGSYIVNEDAGEGATITHVDATHKESWVYFDLDTQQEVPASQAIGSTEWDLAFQRFKIISNGGVSGPGPVEVAALPDADFAGLTQAPKEGYLRDAPDGDDGNQDVDSAFLIGDGWYAYDLLAHKVLPRPIVYVVHTDRAYFKLQLLAYYDEAGTAARPTLKWSPLAPRAP